MKKCPECGNPSYDGAPVCGNCGYKFPKPKVKAVKKEDIFEDRPIIDNSGDNPSTIDIIKENKLVIGAILIITLIVIGMIIATGPTTDKSTTHVDGLNKYSDAKISFSYPSSWKEVNGSDELHSSAIFFEGSNKTTVEYYNVSGEFSSIPEVNNQRISSALENGNYINTIQPIKIDGKNASNIIIENNDGSLTRYISIVSNSGLYVFKINGNSSDAVTSDEINSVLNSTAIK